MWPWEHLATGYLCYSVYARRRYGHAPEPLPVIALGATTQLPDVIDKPLAWTLSVLPSGYSLGHSVFLATAVVALAVALERRHAIEGLGAAVGIGYVSHLLGDLAYPLLRGGVLNLDIVLWPLVPGAVDAREGLLEETARLFAEFTAFLGSPRGLTYLLLEVALLGGAVVLWRLDGWPGLQVG